MNVVDNLGLSERIEPSIGPAGIAPGGTPQPDLDNELRGFTVGPEHDKARQRRAHPAIDVALQAGFVDGIIGSERRSDRSKDRGKTLALSESGGRVEGLHHQIISGISVVGSW